jgi:hypothetical protein
MSQRTLFSISLLFILSGDLSGQLLGDIRSDDAAQKARLLNCCRDKQFRSALTMILSSPSLLSLFSGGEKNPLHYGSLNDQEWFVGRVYDLRKDLAIFKDEHGITPYHVARARDSEKVIELWKNIVHDEGGDPSILH